MNIRKYIHVVAGLTALLLLLGSCRKDSQSTTPTLDDVQTTLSTVGATTGSRAVALAGESFFVKVSAPTSWEIELTPTESSSWLSLETRSGNATREQGLIVRVTPNTGAQRTATLTLRSGVQTATLRLIQQGISAPDPTPDPGPGGGDTPIIPEGEHIHGDPTRIEIPQLAGGSNHYFISHTLSDGSVNYSLEYDTDRRHARWVAFTFDKVNSVSNVRRTDAWAWDPMVPRQFSTDNWFASTGFSRGHLVASADRLSTREANEQTFYYTNMSPQMQVHNGGIWQNLEAKVQAWGRSDSFRDVLYVAKGATIRDGQIRTNKIRGIMVIPEYFYMAMVVERAGVYHGIAFWTEHREYPKGTPLRSLAVSIDKLEELTGIDFFPALPDDVEQSIEAEQPGSFSWPGL